MAETIDLTGRGGLASKHYGDITGEQKPNLRYVAEENQMVQGMYNPFRKFGYLAPSNKKENDVTLDGDSCYLVHAVYDSINYNLYFAERKGKIFKGDTLAAENLTEVLEINETSEVSITDMVMYQLGGGRAIYIASKEGDKGDIYVLNLGDNSIDSLPKGENSVEFKSTQREFIQYVGYVNSIFDRIKLYMKFVGTDNDFDLEVDLLPNTDDNLPDEDNPIATSKKVSATSLSMSKHEGVVFEFDENQELTEDFWIRLKQPSTDYDENKYTLSIVDSSDLVYDGKTQLAFQNEDTTATERSDTSSGGSASDEENKEVYSYDIEIDSGGESPYGKVNIKFDISASGTNDYAAELKVNDDHLVDDEYESVSGPTPGGDNSSRSYWLNTEGSVELNITKTMSDSDTITIILNEWDGGTLTVNNIEVTYTDWSTVKQLSYEILIPQLLENWLSDITKNSFNTSTSEVKLVPADNGLLYILDGNAVHSVNGSVFAEPLGDVSSNILLFPGYFDIVDGVDWRGHLLIALNARPIEFDNLDEEQTHNFIGKCGVYVWDRKSSASQMSDYVPIDGIKEIRSIYVSPDGSVRLITVATNGLAEIRQYDGNEFQVLKEIGFKGYPTHTSSIKAAGNLTYWVAENGYLYAHGAFEPGDDEALVILNKFDDLDQTGVLFYGDDEKDSFYISYSK